MLDLAVSRDATIMFESAHIRDEKPERFLKALPKGPAIQELEKSGYSFDRPSETWATPGQSQLYNTLRKRIIEEVLKPDGRAADPIGARGVPFLHIAAVIGTWLFAATSFVVWPSPLTGVALGLSMCWIGLAIQHTANHGGLTKNARLGYLLGLLNDVGPGGSSLVWRYHHQVSHHAYCNDGELDQDAHSSYPMMRLDKEQMLQPWHKYQWLYGLPAFTQLWISIHMQDFLCLLNARTFLVRFQGTSAAEIVLAMCLKFVHFLWFYFMTMAIHGFKAMLLLFLILPRLAIDIVLLWLGCRWLVATANFGDLLMNAIALEFILLFKELMYNAVTPKHTMTETAHFEVPDNRELRVGWLSYMGSFLWLGASFLWCYLYIHYFQQVLPDYRWDIHSVCESYIAQITALTNTDGMTVVT